MSRLSLAASLGVVALTAILSAQATSIGGKADRRAIHSIRVKVIGCVVSGTKGQFRLMNASLSGDGFPASVGTAGRTGSGEDLSFENSRSFDLIGSRLETQVGHKVEIVGITSDTKLNNTDAFNSAIGSSAHEKATLTVRSVKMIAAACP
jgi:hypothetical protein